MITPPDIIVGLRAAAKAAGVSHQAIVYWIEKHGIGEKIGNEWHINADRLAEIVKARDILKLRQ